MNPNDEEVAAMSGLPNLRTNPSRYGYEDPLIEAAILPPEPIVISPDATYTVSTWLQAGNKETVVRRRDPKRPHDDVPADNPDYEPFKIVPMIELQ